MRILGHSLSRSLPGECSEEPQWVIVYQATLTPMGASGYMHTNPSLRKLLWEVLTEYGQDQHLFGY